MGGEESSGGGDDTEKLLSTTTVLLVATSLVVKCLWCLFFKVLVQLPLRVKSLMEGNGEIATNFQGDRTKSSERRALGALGPTLAPSVHGTMSTPCGALNGVV